MLSSYLILTMIWMDSDTDKDVDHVAVMGEYVA